MTSWPEHAHRAASHRQPRDTRGHWANDGTRHPGIDPNRCPDCQEAREPVHGMCTACGSIEVQLHKATGTRDFSGIGESDRYPTGYGCEVCS